MLTSNKGWTATPATLVRYQKRMSFFMRVPTIICAEYHPHV